MQSTHTTAEAGTAKVTRKKVKIDSVTSIVKCLEKEIRIHGLKTLGIDRGFSPDYYLLSELNYIRQLIEDLK